MQLSANVTDNGNGTITIEGESRSSTVTITVGSTVYQVQGELEPNGAYHYTKTIPKPPDGTPITVSSGGKVVDIELSLSAGTAQVTARGNPGPKGIRVIEPNKTQVMLMASGESTPMFAYGALDKIQIAPAP
jgi:hypothetical protein